MNVKYDANGLIPAIAQDALTGEVLMQAYMNEEALFLTLSEGYMTYYSRSRKELWQKGKTSGHYQRVAAAYVDCDGDSLLFKVFQEGAACHTGNKSCFFEEIKNDGYPDYKIIFDIANTVKDRKASPKDGSYTNYLFDKGTDKICKKIGEEATELVIAAKNKDKAEIAGEASDLIYHMLVLLENEGVGLESIFAVLGEREGKPANQKYALLLNRLKTT